MNNQHQNFEENLYEGYSYVVHTRYNNTIYLRCRYYRSLFCHGRGRIDDGIFVPVTIHNHAQDADLNIIDRFLTNLEEACRTQFQSSQAIYNYLSIIHREAALIYSFRRVSPRMRGWRNNRDFPAVLSIDQLYETINQPRYGQLMVHNNGEIQMQIVRTSIINETVGATFTDNQLSSIITTNNEPLFITINQSHIPHAMNIVQNLAIIVQHRNYCFPLGWSLMNNTNRLTYRGVIRQISNTTHVDYAPRKVYYNFNNNVYQVLKNLFDGETVLKGTFSSHCNINLEKVVTLNIELNRDNLIFIKKLISLSLLPSDRIIEAFNVLNNTIPVEMIEMIELFRYYNDNWIVNVGPENLSFYEDIDALLNCQDSHWMMIDSLLFRRNRTICNYLESYYKYYIQAYSMLDRIAERRTRYGIPRANHIIHRPTINRLWGLINNQAIGTAEFLNVTIALLNQYVNNIIFTGVRPNHNFVVAIYNTTEEVANMNDNVINRNEPVEDPFLVRRDRLIEEGHFVTGDGRCLGCVVATVEMEFLPCKHLVICEACLERMNDLARRNQTVLRCPMCRAIPADLRRVE